MPAFSTRTIASAATLLAGGVLLAGCGSSSSGTAASSAAPAASSSAPAPSSAASSASGGSATAVTATETDFHIALSTSTFAPGMYTFTATNAGKAPHALEIDGPGVEDKASSGIMPGQSTTLTVALQAGTYEIYCPVANHKSLGMDLHITVGGAAGSSTGATTSSSDTGSGSTGY